MVNKSLFKNIIESETFFLEQFFWRVNINMNGF